MNSHWGTPTLHEIYPNKDSFNNLESVNVEVDYESLYYLLISKFGDSNTRYTNTELFKLNLAKNINIYYPELAARIRDQKRLREAATAEFQQGGKNINNAASYNTQDLSNDTIEAVPLVDSQTISNVQRGELAVLLDRLDNYRSGYEEKFLEKFKPLFLAIIAPQSDLYYVSEVDNGTVY